jgi:hypothetical protein
VQYAFMPGEAVAIVAGYRELHHSPYLFFVIL